MSFTIHSYASGKVSTNFSPHSWWGKIGTEKEILCLCFTGPKFMTSFRCKIVFDHVNDEVIVTNLYWINIWDKICQRKFVRVKKGTLVDKAKYTLLHASWEYYVRNINSLWLRTDVDSEVICNHNIIVLNATITIFLFSSSSSNMAEPQCIASASSEEIQYIFTSHTTGFSC